jgi:hypothetical protein
MTAKTKHHKNAEQTQMISKPYEIIPLIPETETEVHIIQEELLSRLRTVKSQEREFQIHGRSCSREVHDILKNLFNKKN